MAYRPLLGMGPEYELAHWQVWLTMLTTTLGLVAFASGIERWFIRRATWVETLLFWLAAIGLLWPTYLTDVAGFIALAAAVALQKMNQPHAA